MTHVATRIILDLLGVLAARLPYVETDRAPGSRSCEACSSLKKINVEVGGCPHRDLPRWEGGRPGPERRSMFRSEHVQRVNSTAIMCPTGRMVPDMVHDGLRAAKRFGQGHVYHPVMHTENGTSSDFQRFKSASSRSQPKALHF